MSRIEWQSQLLVLAGYSTAEWGVWVIFAEILFTLALLG